MAPAEQSRLRWQRGDRHGPLSGQARGRGGANTEQADARRQHGGRRHARPLRRRCEYWRGQGACVQRGSLLRHDLDRLRAGGPMISAAGIG